MLFRLFYGFGWLSCVAMVLVVGSAHAQGRLDARYEATLAGIPIGKGSWTIVIGEADYSATTNGATTGLVKVIGGGKGTSSVQGKVLAGQLAPNAYVSSVDYGTKNETIRIALVGNNITQSSIEPEPPPTPDRLPVSDVHRHGVSDPMSGAMFRVPGNGDVLGPDGCSAKAAIFDGRMRYDLQLAYKRTEALKLAKGATVPTTVCAIYFKPVSGYVPSRAAIKYLAARQDMEVALAPVAGTRILVPVRIQIPTPLGVGVVEATEFNTVATPRAQKTH